MKRFLFLLSLAAVLTIAGCGNDDGNDEAGDQNNTEENQNESSNGNNGQDNDSQSGDNTNGNDKAAQSALLDTQMSLVQEIRPHNKKVAAVQSDLKALSDTEDDKEKEELKTSIKEGASEAQKAADEAKESIDSFEPSSKLPEDMKDKVNEALKDLKAYFQEAKSALDTPIEADFSKANEKFKAFQDKIGSLYEKVGLNAPNLGDEMK